MKEGEGVIVVFTSLTQGDRLYKFLKGHNGKFTFTRCSIDDPDLSDSVDAINRILSPTVMAASLMLPKPAKPSKGPKSSPNTSKNPFPKNNKPASFGKANLRFPKAGRGR